MDAAPPKPLLRGVLHQVSFFVALIAGVWLLRVSEGELRWACLVYLFALCGQLAVSALYHRVTWAPSARQWWRRVDHAFIMILIAGTATPLFIAAEAPNARTVLLALWGGASLGVARALFWIGAPKWVAAVLALVLAWVMVPFVPLLWSVLGPVGMAWLMAGGLVYSLGGLAYAFKRPNPWPRVFGYHEVFHTCVVLAAAFQFVPIARVVLGLR